MNTLEDNIKLRKLWFTESEIFIETTDGLKLSHPLSWFPKLQKASTEQRNKYELSPFGIHWPTLDEALSFSGFLDYKKR